MTEPINSKPVYFRENTRRVVKINGAWQAQARTGEKGTRELSNWLGSHRPVAYDTAYIQATTFNHV